MDKPMDEQDRKHCLLDLHQVQEGTSASAFVAKWRDGLEWLLSDESAGNLADELEADLTKAEAQAEGFKDKIREAGQHLNQLAKAVRDVDRIIEELHTDVSLDL